MKPLYILDLLYSFTKIACLSNEKADFMSHI